MKKYKLLKDLPDIDSGVEFLLDDSILYSPSAWEEVQRQREAGVAIVFLYPGRGRYKADFFKDFDAWFEEVKPERWRPKSGELYYYLNSLLDTDCTPNYNDLLFKSDLNVFRTREQAEEAARRVKETLMRYQDELLQSECCEGGTLNQRHDCRKEPGN